jgi:uncharacterized protein (TIGR03437 family)
VNNGRAIAVGVRGTSQFVVTPANPARAGDVLVIYCSGLGAVDGSVGAGTLSPSSPPAAVRDAVRVTIGGLEAPVSFAGLTPGFAGLYQINATVPSGVPTGETRIVIGVSNQTSPASLLPIQ